MPEYAPKEIVRIACADRNYKWPEHLSSGVMFYHGYRVTIEQFQKQCELFSPK